MIAQIDRDYIRTNPLRLWSRLISYGLFEGRPQTTQGRWINPLVLSFLRTLTVMPVTKKIDKPVFIIGTGRSGTTILGIVLSMHRHVGFLNEPKALWHVINAREDLIGNYTEQSCFYRFSEEDIGENAIRDAHRLYSIYLMVSGNSRLVDKYPELIFRVPYVLSLFPDARFLFLVRNGWETCQSIVNWSDRNGVVSNNKACDWWGVNDRKWITLVDQLAGDLSDESAKEYSAVDRAALEWVLSMREGLSVIRSYPQNCLMVRYENLVNNVNSNLQTIFDFCELSSDDAVFKYAAKVLRPGKLYSPVPLNPKLSPIFLQTMGELSYE